MLEQEQQHELFQKGDRVVLQGLTSSSGSTDAAEMNGRHGMVAVVGLRCAVHLDVLKTVIIQPVHLRKEDASKVASYAIQDRAAVSSGALILVVRNDDDANNNHTTAASCISSNSQAAAMIHTFHIMRWIVASYFMKEHNTSILTTVQQIPTLSAETSLELNAYAVKHWKGDGGVYDRFLEYVKANRKYEYIVQAMNDVRAMKSWHLVGLHQDFWFVARDDTGTYVVPDINKDVVYKVVSLVVVDNNKNRPLRATAAVDQHSATLIKVPMRLRITVLPWYGRLLYDTSLAPPRQDNVMLATDDSFANRLHGVVLQSIQKGRVIEHLAELEDDSNDRC